MGAVCIAGVDNGESRASGHVNQTGHSLMFTDEVTRAEACVSLLAEVDFKWLMAGQGHWIDLARFRSDSSYAAGLIRLALASKSFALRECAALLKTHRKGSMNYRLAAR